MTCKICCAFPHLAGKTEFVSGCRTFKKETLQKHNIGGHLRIRDTSLAKQKPMKNSPNAQGLRRGGKVLEEQNREELEVKENTAYLIAKEELPFPKFHPILSLQKKNGLDLNMTYANDKGCNNFVSQISTVMTEQLAVEVSSKKYISLLIDGATDASKKENETVHCRYVKDGQSLNWLVGHNAVAHGRTQGKFLSKNWTLKKNLWNKGNKAWNTDYSCPTGCKSLLLQLNCSYFTLTASIAKYLFRVQILHLDEILVVAVDDEKFSYHCRKQSIVFNLEVYLFLTTFEGILDTVKKSFEGVGILEWKYKLVSIGVEGASVNLGKKGGVAALLWLDIPYLIDFHCLPHRLELALIEMQRSCRQVEIIYEVLQMIWKTYHYSP